jgi:hypothetical protein
MTLNPNERKTVGVGRPQRLTPSGGACPRMSGRRACPAVALALLALLLPAPAPAQSYGQEHVSTTLWQQYPLDPQGESTKVAPPSQGETTKVAPTARPDVRPARPVFGSSSSAQDGEFPWLLLAGAVGAVVLLEILLVGFRVAAPTVAMRALHGARFSKRATAGGRRRGSARLRQRRRPPDASRARPDRVSDHAEPRPHQRTATDRPQAASVEEGAEPMPLKPLPRGGGPAPAEPSAGLSPPPGEEQRVPWNSAATNPEARRGPPVELSGGARAPLPTGPARLEHCQIVWWRDGVVSDFYALADGRGGQAEIIARSRPFRWRHSQPPPQWGSAAEAHAGLLDTLAALGWEPLSRAPHAWYATRLRRAGPIPLRELHHQLGGRRR